MLLDFLRANVKMTKMLRTSSALLIPVEMCSSYFFPVLFYSSSVVGGFRRARGLMECVMKCFCFLLIDGSDLGC